MHAFDTGRIRPWAATARSANLDGVTHPVPHGDVEHRLAAADAAARRPEWLEDRLKSVTPMTEDRWDSLAIDDLTEEEADAFFQAINE